LNTIDGEVCITVLHSCIKWYSAGFGGSKALHGKTLGLPEEMIDTRLPPLICFNQNSEEDLIHVLLVEEVQVPSDALVEAYSNLPAANNLMAPPTLAAGGKYIYILHTGAQLP
jgi:hypothetical protein